MLCLSGYDEASYGSIGGYDEASYGSIGGYDEAQRTYMSPTPLSIMVPAMIRSKELAPSSSRGKRPAELPPSSPRGKRPAEPAPSPPRVKRKRIKYDQATVLTNEFMKKSIDDASGLKRKRKGVSSFLDVYRINNALKKEKVLSDPVITGLCDNLSELFEDDNVSSKAQLINIEQAKSDAMEFGR